MTLPSRRLAEFSAMLVVWVVLVLLFGGLSDNFLSLATFASLANRIPALAVVAAGMTLVIISGGIDLSVGSVLGLCGAVLGTVLVDWHQPLWVAACGALATGLVAGAVNGLVTVWFGVPSFIVTLGMLEIARGLAYLTTQSQTRYIGSAVEGLSAPIAGLAVSWASIVAVGVIAAAQIVLSRTVFGRYLVAIGTNESAVRLAGVNPRPTRIAVFAALGAMTGLAAVFYTSRLGSSDPNAGAGLELSAIAAVVIGGTSLFGGEGNLFASLVGALIIATLRNGLNVLGVYAFWQQVAIGAILIAAVYLDRWRRRRRGE
jgi:ribose transport system permease protein